MTRAFIGGGKRSATRRCAPKTLGTEPATISSASNSEPALKKRLALRWMVPVVVAALAPLICVNAVLGLGAADGLTATVTRPVLPILIRNGQAPLMRIAVEVEKGVDARMSSLVFKLDDADVLVDLTSLRLFATGDKKEFSEATPLGESVEPAATVTLLVDQPLRIGKNVFWLSCRLKDTSDLSHRFAAVCASIETTAGQLTPRDLSSETGPRIGFALRKRSDNGAGTDRLFWEREVSKDGAAYLERLRRGTPFGTNNFDLAGLRAGMGTRHEPTIPGVKLRKVKVGGLPCEWVIAPGANPDIRLLYLHGGGWVSGSGGNYLPLAADISLEAKCAVLLPDYRLAPEHCFPAGLEDCLAAHDWLVANGPAGPKPAQATFIAGDSAGGNLTLATLIALRDRKRPLPAGGIAISAATDFTLASESLKSVHDPIISARTMPEFRKRYLEKTATHNPLVSPVFGNYRGVPPLLIQVGEHEMLRDDSIRVAKKARSDGIDVTLEVWPGMVHVFQIRGLPESREAIMHIGEFIRSHLPDDAVETSTPEFASPDLGLECLEQLHECLELTA